MKGRASACVSGPTFFAAETESERKLLGGIFGGVAMKCTTKRL